MLLTQSKNVEVLVDTDLDTLATALVVTTDDLLKASPASEVDRLAGVRGGLQESGDARYDWRAGGLVGSFP